MNKPSKPKTKEDLFTVQISENLELRNLLRSGLVKAQGSETDKIPLFISWPNWLEDGIVCMYSQDFKQLLHDTVRDTALTIGSTIRSGDSEKTEVIAVPGSSEPGKTDDNPVSFQKAVFPKLSTVDKEAAALPLNPNEPKTDQSPKVSFKPGIVVEKIEMEDGEESTNQS